MFSDKYDTLYNSVAYDTNGMKLIERELLSRIQKCNDESYNITVHDVIDAVTHLKVGKSDGYEGLLSDHFIYNAMQRKAFGRVNYCKLFAELL